MPLVLYLLGLSVLQTCNIKSREGFLNVFYKAEIIAFEKENF